jgi:hypothetical protein
MLMLALLLPLPLALAIRKQGSYEIINVLHGWLAPESKLIIKVPDKAKLLALTLQMPTWMPVQFPTKLQTLRDGQLEETFQFKQPGKREIYIPLNKRGTITFKSDASFVPAQLGLGPDDSRLAYRLLSAVVGKEGAYNITNLASDGYLSPDSTVIIRVASPGRCLVLALYVPNWMPFDYPVKLQTMRDEHLEETFTFPESGTHKIHIPLDTPGIIGLKIDNWFVPAQLGVGSSDQRHLAYRLIRAAVGEDGLSRHKWALAPPTNDTSRIAYKGCWWKRR